MQIDNQKVFCRTTTCNYQRLNQIFCLCRSVDPYGANPDGQATFHDGHKIIVLIWPVCFSKGLSTLHV